MTSSTAARGALSDLESVAPAELASRLASKLCHDFISPAGAIVSGLDLLNDPAATDMREDAMSLIDQSARKLVDLLTFARIAYGASAGAAELDGAEVEALVRRLYAHSKAQLEWAAPAGAMPRAAAQALLNLAQLAAGALPLGGSARMSLEVEGGGVRIEVVAAGPKARLHAEVREGLEGRAQGDGLPGRWAPAAYLRAIVAGAVEAEAADDRVTFRATIPA